VPAVVCSVEACKNYRDIRPTRREACGIRTRRGTIVGDDANLHFTYLALGGCWVLLNCIITFHRLG